MAVVVTKILKRIGKKTIACGVFNLPATFWKTGPTLWVDSALAPILQAATSLPARHVAFSPHLIMKVPGAYDSEILANGAGLPRKNKYIPSQFLQLAQTLIEAQPGGIAGDLLSDGKANIFYVSCSGRVFAVSVYWLQDAQRWFVSVWLFDGYRWYAGSQVFSPAT